MLLDARICSQTIFAGSNPKAKDVSFTRLKRDRVFPVQHAMRINGGEAWIEKRVANPLTVQIRFKDTQAGHEQSCARWRCARDIKCRTQLVVATYPLNP